MIQKQDHEKRSRSNNRSCLSDLWCEYVPNVILFLQFIFVKFRKSALYDLRDSLKCTQLSNQKCMKVLNPSEPYKQVK